MKISTYTIRDKVHEGVATSLYRGHRDTDGVPVLARLLTAENPPPHELARLRHEYLLLKSIDLPGVIKAQALERHGNGVALILDQPKGKLLSEVLAARRLPIETVLRLTLSLVDTLGQLHQQGIIHRDLKPHSLFVDLEAQSLVLIDLASATWLDREVPQSASLETLPGTLAYMSPEHIGRMNQCTDCRSDFYSIGVMLYEMLTGALPFPSRSPREVDAGVPLGLSALVMKLLEKAPESRYQSASGLKADLEKCQRQYEASGEISAFTLGERDRSAASISGPRTPASGSLDPALVLHAAHAIASEITFDRVLDQLLRTVAESAGAQRGFLILDRNGRQGHSGALWLSASIDLDAERVDVDLNKQLESCTELAVSIVQFVARTGEPLMLANAAAEPRFADDVYVANHQPKSLLCLPLQHRGRLTGVVYLENNRAPDVFTKERLELLRLLSSQAAASVENALLYGHVAKMTQQLQASNDELRAMNDRLQLELAERGRAEQERAQLKDEIIRAQNARLAEMSTPLIPITEQIMVMPLIGTMDTQRAHQVLETALQGAQHSRAQVVIIDITGMRHVDTNVAGALIQAATALRLLGAQALLTGIRPDVAQTLVGLGVDMKGIVTSGTLQAGIAHALKISGNTTLDGSKNPLEPHRRGKLGI